MLAAMFLIEDVLTSLMLADDCWKNSFIPIAAFTSPGTPQQLQPGGELTEAMTITKYESMDSYSLISQPPWLLTMMIGGHQAT